MPALYLPWTTTASELTQPGTVPQYVKVCAPQNNFNRLCKDRLVTTLKMLPSSWEKEIKGFHDWIPRCP